MLIHIDITTSITEFLVLKIQAQHITRANMISSNTAKTDITITQHLTTIIIYPFIST